MARLHYPAALCAAAMLASCGGSQPLVGSPGATPQGRAIAQQAAHGKSWMLPEARREALLYASYNSGSNTGVQVYTYPKGKLVGTLTGFQGPAGMCPDKDGNIWITNFNGTTIVEYAHGGTQPIGSLTLPTLAHPQDCAIDTATGNLAVVGYPPASESATVLVFTGATGTPTVYDIPLSTSSFCSYDSHGNLFVNGYAQGNGPFGVVELQRGSNGFATIAFPPSGPARGYEPTSLQWDGRHLVVGSPYSVIRYSIANLNAVEKGETKLDVDHLTTFWIQGRKVSVIDRDHELKLYGYPAGGAPLKTIGQGGLFSTIVSLAPR